MPEKRWVRRCVVERGEIWSNEPIPMFGTNDEPGGAAFICSPDVCKSVARVITRWSELGPLWLTASTKTLKWCTEEALYYWGQFPKNTISFLTVFFVLFQPSRQQFTLFQCAFKISLQTQYLMPHHIFTDPPQWTARLLYLSYISISNTRASSAVFKENSQTTENWWLLYIFGQSNADDKQQVNTDNVKKGWCEFGHFLQRKKDCCSAAGADG